jgi:hypothetical protein
LQVSNNVSLRNFNVVAAPAASGFHRFSIRFPDAFDASRWFVLQAAQTLPRDSVVLLELPVALARALYI